MELHNGNVRGRAAVHPGHHLDWNSKWFVFMSLFCSFGVKAEDRQDRAVPMFQVSWAEGLLLVP